MKTRIFLGLFVCAAAIVFAQPFQVYNDGVIDFVPRGITYRLTAQDADTGVQSVYYQINGGEILPYSNPLVFREDGRYSVSYYSVDRMGNISLPQFINFVVDGTPPTISPAVRGPALVKDETVYLTSSTGIILRASDMGSGVAGVYISLDGQNYLRYNEEAFITESGRHTGYVYALDRVGNRSDVLQFSLVVDNTPPDVRIVPLQPLEVIQGERFTAAGNSFIIRATDSVSGVQSIEVSVGRREFFTYYEPIVITEPGFHSIRARAIDNLGNVSPITELTVTVDSRKPSVMMEMELPAGQ